MLIKAIILGKSGWHVLAIHANPATMIGIFNLQTTHFSESMPKHVLDAYDRRILEALQQNGRLTNVELAEQIGLSPSPCLRRVRMPVVDATDMHDAVRWAAALTVSGDAVVLSPACASYDMFQNFGHRGRVFRDAVSALGARRLDQ